MYGVFLSNNLIWQFQGKAKLNVKNNNVLLTSLRTGLMPVALSFGLPQPLASTSLGVIHLTLIDALSSFFLVCVPFYFLFDSSGAWFYLESSKAVPCIVVCGKADWSGKGIET